MFYINLDKEEKAYSRRLPAKKNLILVDVIALKANYEEVYGKRASSTSVIFSDQGARYKVCKQHSSPVLRF